MPKEKRTTIREVVKLFVTEPLLETTPNGKIGRTITGETFYGYQKRRRKKAKTLPKPMQKAFRVLEKSERLYNDTIILSIAIPFLPAIWVTDQLEKHKNIVYKMGRHW